MADRPAAAYTLDERVVTFLNDATGVLLRAALGDAQHRDDFAVVLRDLESLATRATEGRAGAVDMVDRDGWPLFDPAGQATILTMWQAVIDELGEREWNRFDRPLRSGGPLSPTTPRSGDHEPAD